MSAFIIRLLAINVFVKDTARCLICKSKYKQYVETTEFYSNWLCNIWRTITGDIDTDLNTYESSFFNNDYCRCYQSLLDGEM